MVAFQNTLYLVDKVLLEAVHLALYHLGVVQMRMHPHKKRGLTLYRLLPPLARCVSSPVILLSLTKFDVYILMDSTLHRVITGGYCVLVPL